MSYLTALFLIIGTIERANTYSQVCPQQNYNLANSYNANLIVVGNVLTNLHNSTELEVSILRIVHGHTNLLILNLKWNPKHNIECSPIFKNKDVIFFIDKLKLLAVSTLKHPLFVEG